MSYILASPASAGVTGTLELDYIASMGPILIHQTVSDVSAGVTAIVWALYGQGGERI